MLSSFSNAAGSAAIQGNQVFGPYGDRKDAQGTINTAKGFTGQYNDSLTGLDYYNARYYDPRVGVFLSADSVQGNAQGMNPYAYVKGNPETYSDPTGQMFIQPGGGGGDSGNSGGGGNNGDQWWIDQARAIQQITLSKFSIWGTDINSFTMARIGLKAAVEDAYNKNRDGSNTVLFNSHIAYLLAMEIQAYRKSQGNYTNANYADAFWYITNRFGGLYDDGFIIPRPQVSSGPGSHSETSLMRRLMGDLTGGLKAKITDILANLPLRKADPPVQAGGSCWARLEQLRA